MSYSGWQSRAGLARSTQSTENVARGVFGVQFWRLATSTTTHCATVSIVTSIISQILLDIVSADYSEAVQPNLTVACFDLIEGK